jgi:hypothetical protein
VCLLVAALQQGRPAVPCPAVPGPKAVFTLAETPLDALRRVSQADAGLTVTLLGGKAPTRESVGAQLAQLSPEDQAILIARFQPTPKGPTPAPAGKGKQK